MEETNFIISLTTLPNRIKYLKIVIDALCNQKYDNYEVHLNVPINTKFDGKYEADLEHLKNDKLKIFFVEDVGAVTKLYYTLLRTTNPEQRIITVDDDFIYNEDMLDEYNYQLTKNSDDVIGFAGIYPIEKSYRADGTLDCVGPVDTALQVGILEGYKTVCYKRNHFNDDFFENGYKLHYNDDLAIFSWLGSNGIKKICIPYRFEIDFNTRMLSFPLKQEIGYPKSGINHQRDAEGGSEISYKKFYNSPEGIGLKLPKSPKLPISIGILAWNSGQVLVDTLTTYHNNGLFDMVSDVTILFQEVTPQDIQIASHFGIDCIGLQKNIGIGQAFIKLTENAKSDYVLVLEHDWNLIEDKETTYDTLKRSCQAIEMGLDVVRLRHRKNPGNPHFSFRNIGKELTYYDDEIECTSPHLLDSLHWLDPAVEFPDLIKKTEDMFHTTSRYGNWTNNPCLYKKQFYLDTVKPFAGEGIALEGNISKWWAKQEYKVGHNEGLFKHNDYQKYGK